VSGLSDYQKCLANGWQVGTRLVGDEGYGPTIIEIMYLSPHTLVAKTISHNGIPSEREGLWTLSCRDWQPLSEPPK
jgi:hypothetical protein